MKKILLAALFIIGSLHLSAQEIKDWANFARYEAANKEVKSPKVVFM